MTEAPQQEQPQPQQGQEQYLAVPLSLMAATVKILSNLPYEQVSALIPQLTGCPMIQQKEEK